MEVSFDGFEPSVKAQMKMYTDSKMSAKNGDRPRNSEPRSNIPHGKYSEALRLELVTRRSRVRDCDVAAVAQWYRHRIVAGFVTSSSPVPLKTRRVGQRCTLNLSRAETRHSRWCGVVVRRGGASSGVVHVMTMVQNYVVRRQKALVQLNSATLIFTQSIKITGLSTIRPACLNRRRYSNPRNYSPGIVLLMPPDRQRNQIKTHEIHHGQGLSNAC
ncbi:uncharacterized protein TNCV_288391 [Trichonephila clavipes]|nr:uncharacterized protein TNCV_288391 [Trichonephila clavipes]